MEKINDYSVFNASPYLMEFLKSGDVVNILEAGDTQFNAIETAAFDMFTKIWLFYAEGVQLDNIGAIVGLARDGYNDTQYRARIEFRIYLNKASGTPEALIQALHIIYEITTAVIVFEYPAKVRIYNSEVDLVSTELYPLVPAGVEVLVDWLLSANNDVDTIIVTDDGVTYDDMVVNTL